MGPYIFAQILSKMKFRNFLLLLLTVAFALPAFAQFGNSSHRQFNESMDRAAMMDFIRYMNAKNNGENLKGWWKTEEILGITIAPKMPFALRSFYKAPEYSSQPSFDTTVVGEADYAFGIHLNTSSDHLLFRLGGNSIITLSHGALAQYITWHMPEIGLITTVNGKKGHLAALNFGLPITLDYKWGADVDWNPDVKACFAVGGGVVPQLNSGFFEMQNTSFRGTIVPMVYASAGFYAGVCFKVRASWQPASYALFKGQETYDAGATRQLHATMPGTFNIGVGMMARSYDWRHARSWRTGPNGERSSRSSGGGRRRAKSSYGVMRMY